MSTCLTTETSGEVTDFRDQIRASSSSVSIEAFWIREVLDESPTSFAASGVVVVAVAVSRFEADAFIYGILTTFEKQDNYKFNFN